MRLVRRAIPAALLLAIPLAATTVCAQQVGASGRVERVGFLAGCWELRTATRVVQEQWMSPLGGMMLGMGRTVVSAPTGERVREWESTRIELREGVVTYVAQPMGNAPTFFPATSVSDSAVTFSNPQHDFPQRVIYARRGADSLHARIEGGEGGQVRGIDFRYARVPCPGTTR